MVPEPICAQRGAILSGTQQIKQKYGGDLALAREALGKQVNRGRGHFFVSMCDLTQVVVDYWWMSCREIAVSSIGLPSQSMKRIWLGPMIRQGLLRMDGCGIGDCVLEELALGQDMQLPPVTKSQVEAAFKDVKQKQL